jgi:hypothetical protein
MKRPATALWASSCDARASAMRIVSVFIMAVTTACVAVSSVHAQQAATVFTFRVSVEVPDSSGMNVTLRYVEGPDSLRGQEREVVVPAVFQLQARRLTLIAERTKGHGTIVLRVERLGTSLRGEGAGDLVRIVVSDSGLTVRVHPWWLPW